MTENTISISKKQMWRYSTFLLAGVLLIGGFFVFAGKGELGITGNTIAGPIETVEIKTIIQDFQYQPDKITVKEGSKIRLTIQNKDNVLHGLHLPQFGLVDGVPGGLTKTFEFTAVETPTNGQAIPTCTQEHGEMLTINVI